ncbi:MAG TPA: ribosome biogenesis GTPase Der [Candidatus Polarisedimenticolaceae bacterium]|nr:ribosome biogenesis GTPase Der [Candidatus Polarisedimenticolaceae bacterium]
MRRISAAWYVAAVSPPPLVAIVGAPNVGKSTLFNRLVGRRKSLVTDEPGLTRDRVYGDVRNAPRPFRLVDTGGLRWDDVPFGKEILLQAESALEEARLVIFVVDARSGPTALDTDVASFLRRRGANVVLVANKIDEEKHRDAVHDLHRLGLGEPLAVSAEHGRGIDVLLEEVATRLEGAGAGEEADPEPPAIKIALVGRPNVGKSSILNRLVGEERMVVSDIPGTTRDAVDTRLVLPDGRRYQLVDTAGMRRRGKVQATAESLSVMQARHAIDRADVVVLVLDGSEPLSAQDTHIAGYSQEALRPVVVAVNKWDLVEGREQRAKAWAEDVRIRLKFLKDVPMVLVSAKTGQRVDRILRSVDEVYASASRSVTTPEINKWLQEEAARERRSPAKGGSIRLFYATQTGVRPPRFVLFCNDARRIHFSMRRRLENSLRERFGFGSAPMRLTFRSRREPATR